MSEPSQKLLRLKVALIGLSIFALLVWYSMPIFPDEIAVRLLSGRYVQDHGASQKLFHYCSANARETPVIFVIPALIFSWVDLSFSPVGIRILPFIITLAPIVTSIFLAMRKGAPYAAVVATTALVGVAGSGLIMARTEYVQVFNIACCLGALYFVESGVHRRFLRYGIAIILALSVLLSLYGHIQGLLFLPLTLFIIFRLVSPTLGKNRTAILTAILLFFAAYSTIAFHKFSCVEHPEIEQYVADKVFNPERLQSLGLGEWARVEMKKYYLSFIYKDYYQINYLPGIIAGNRFKQALLEVLNLSVVIVLLFNFCLFLYAGILGSAFLIKQIGLRVGSSPALRASHLLMETVLTLMLIVMPVLFLFFYDSDRNFYRSFLINLLIAIVLAVVISRRLDARVPAFAKLYFGFCGGVVLVSLLVNLWWFKEKLDAGFEGPSIAIKQNWSAIDQDVRKLAEESGMDLSKGRIVVDDMTYESLKSYPYLYPITYLHMSALLTGEKPSYVIKATRPNYVLARCDSFRSAGLDFQRSRNQLCGLNLDQIKRENNE